MTRDFFFFGGKSAPTTSGTRIRSSPLIASADWLGRPEECVRKKFSFRNPIIFRLVRIRHGGLKIFSPFDCARFGRTTNDESNNRKAISPENSTVLQKIFVIESESYFLLFAGPQPPSPPPFSPSDFVVDYSFPTNRSVYTCSLRRPERTNPRVATNYFWWKSVIRRNRHEALIIGWKRFFREPANLFPDANGLVSFGKYIRRGRKIAAKTGAPRCP